MRARALLICLCAAITQCPALAADLDDAVAKRAIRGESGRGQQLLVNPGFEDRDGARVVGWEPWDVGFEHTAKQRRSGAGAVVCTLGAAEVQTKVQRGAGQTVVLDQTTPRPIIAVGWSSADKVSGAPDSSYSLYLDIVYQDGTPLWGQIASFDTGTHGWQRRERLVVPDKPIKQVNVYAIFRGHTGTACFDDFALYEVAAGAGTCLFDGTPVLLPKGAPQARTRDGIELKTSDGLALVLSRDEGDASFRDSDRRGGFLLRDVEERSDFHRVDAQARPTPRGAELSGLVDALGLQLEASFTVKRGHVRVDGVVSSVRPEDRAVSVYFVLPFDAMGGRWYDDARSGTLVRPGAEYKHTCFVGAGATQQMSAYTLGCVANQGTALTLGIPMDVPRVFRIGYNSTWREYYIVFDLGLASEPKLFPNRATFSFVLYRVDPAWGFRAALKKYYTIFPEFFEKRVQREGLWMAFTDISTVERPEDFHFAIHEGNNNVAWDDEHDVLSFVYTEPMTNWMRMPKGMPRTYEAALEQLEKNLRSANKQLAQQSITTRLAGVRRSDGSYSLSILDAPWCDGAVFALNPSPALTTTPENPINQGQFEFAKIERAFSPGSDPAVAHWRAYGSGYEVDQEVALSPKQAIRCTCAALGQDAGAAQTVTLGQQAPRPLVLRAWSRAERVTGGKGGDYSVYADLALADGSRLWGQLAAFSPGTHDWEQAEYVIRTDKPVRQATVHLLFRRTHTGTAWFDDVFLGEVGSDKNLLSNAAFGPAREKPSVLDGTYVDSLEGWGRTKNFDRRQFRDVQIPLTFDGQSGRPAILNIFSTYEFVRDLHRRMRAAGKLTMANSVPYRFAFFGHILDVMGTETNWHRNKKWQPMTDRSLNLKRATCYQKPYCFLMNTHYDDFSFELTERYMKRSLFYGCFPGMFSENAATNTYFGNPRWCNRDRPLFKKYVPLIQTIAKAGWEPITYAHTDRAKVYVERYGPASDGEIFFTVLNDGSAAEPFVLRIGGTALKLGAEAVASELIEGKSVELKRERDALAVRGSLGPEDVRLYRISQHEKGG